MPKGVFKINRISPRLFFRTDNCFSAMHLKHLLEDDKWSSKMIYFF